MSQPRLQCKTDLPYSKRLNLHANRVSSFGQVTNISFPPYAVTGFISSQTLNSLLRRLRNRFPRRLYPRLLIRILDLPLSKMT